MSTTEQGWRFTDAKGRTWDLTITVGVCERVEAALGVSLADTPTDEQLFSRLQTDDYLFAQLLWVIVEPRAEELGVLPEDFGSSLPGAIFDAAEEAFWRGLLNFFRRTKRALLSQAIDNYRQAQIARVETLQKTVTPERLARLIELDSRQMLQQVEDEIARYEEFLRNRAGSPSATASPAS